MVSMLAGEMAVSRTVWIQMLLCDVWSLHPRSDHRHKSY